MRWPTTSHLELWPPWRCRLRDIREKRGNCATRFIASSVPSVNAGPAPGTATTGGPHAPSPGDGDPPGLWRGPTSGRRRERHFLLVLSPGTASRRGRFPVWPRGAGGHRPVSLLG